ncbi:MAG TPA: hypothetical protein VGO39_13230 [Gaiellaceae bacterium]|nr:hypothetical protein [Gaiellaceae bacterium]
MKRITFVIAALAAALTAAGAYAGHHAPAGRATAIVLPAKPSLAAGSRNFRQVYRVGKGVYCVAPAASLDWTATTPYVTPLAARSRNGGTLLASWEAAGQRCPAAAIQVRTFRGHGTSTSPADNVAFEVLIP